MKAAVVASVIGALAVVEVARGIADTTLIIVGMIVVLSVAIARNTRMAK
jgi:hypothetical protein